MTNESNDRRQGSTWTRPEPRRTAPLRDFKNYYRVADRTGTSGNKSSGSLQSTDDVLRLAYKVVDAQIQRGIDIARRLRGDPRAGTEAAAAALDSPEKLLSRGLLAGLELFEAMVNQPGAPLKRLLSAEVRLLGSLLGITLDGSTPGSATATESTARPAQRPATVEPPTKGRVDRGRVPSVRIRHAAASARHAVTVERFDVGGTATQRAERLPLSFHCRSVPSAASMTGFLSFDATGPLLEIETVLQAPPGRWRAAVCDEAGEQLGTIEIRM